jgi:cob(I)alamin adenosyltransferase
MQKAGLVHIYTGDGKGKTTAAFGLALRSAGYGNKVLIFQFLKPASLNLGERKALSAAEKSVTIESLDLHWDLSKSLKDKEAAAQAKKAVKKALEKIARSAKTKKYDLIILDEIVFCLSAGLARISDIRKIIKSKNKSIELVLTGRGATDELMDLADLVTEMKKIKHPFDKGLSARKGIDY